MKTRTATVTQQIFDRLPALISRAEFQMVTGLSDRDLDALRRSGEIGCFRPRGARGYAKYYKTDAAKIGNFRL